MPPRLKRPQLDRTAPIRTWDTLFGPPGGASAGAPSGAGGAPAPFGDTVTRSVETGYRLIDEYLRQGQRVAQGFGAPAATAGGGAPDVNQRTMDLTMGMANAWFMFMTQMLQGFPGNLGAPWPPPTPAAAPPDGTGSAAPDASPGAPPSVNERAKVSGAPRVNLRVESQRRVEVTVDARPTAKDAQLEIVDLRSREDSSLVITDVEASRLEDGGTALAVKVPSEQSAGTYLGLIVDANTNVPCGTLALRVFED